MSAYPSRCLRQAEDNPIDCDLGPPIPETQVDPSSAVWTGYSEAKWVAERILSNARESVDLPAVIVRLGQVCGDRKGYWKENEWFPPIVKSSLSLGCLPDMDEVSDTVRDTIGYSFIQPPRPCPSFPAIPPRRLSSRCANLLRDRSCI